MSLRRFLLGPAVLGPARRIGPDSAMGIGPGIVADMTRDIVLGLGLAPVPYRGHEFGECPDVPHGQAAVTALHGGLRLPGLEQHVSAPHHFLCGRKSVRIGHPHYFTRL